MKYTIEKMPRSNQDKTMRWQRYKVTTPDGSITFVCLRYLPNENPNYSRHVKNHVYFSDDIQNKVDGDILDKIEKDILDLDL